MSFYPPPHRKSGSERPRIPEPPLRQAPASRALGRLRVRTVQPQGLTEAAPSINVTPLIDVVLVLLLVFMAVTPEPVHDLSVQLIGVRRVAAAAPAPTPRQLVLELTDGGGLRLDRRPISADTLGQALAALLRGRKPEDRALFVVASDRVPYERLVEALDQASRAGFDAIGFAADESP